MCRFLPAVGGWCTAAGTRALAKTRQDSRCLHSLAHSLTGAGASLAGAGALTHWCWCTWCRMCVSTCPSLSKKKCCALFPSLFPACSCPLSRLLVAICGEQWATYCRGGLRITPAEASLAGIRLPRPAHADYSTVVLRYYVPCSKSMALANQLDYRCKLLCQLLCVCVCVCCRKE